MTPSHRILVGALAAIASLCIVAPAGSAEYSGLRGDGLRGASVSGGSHWKHGRKFRRHARLRRHNFVGGISEPTIVYGLPPAAAPSVEVNNVECYSFNPACGQPLSTFGLIEYDGKGRAVTQHFESPQPYAPPAFIRVP
jgi:hypothetical protein